jgi:hypothetical protein
MKTYLFVVLFFLLVGQLTLSDEPSKDPNLAMSRPSDRSKTEADQPRMDYFCLDCGSGVTHPSKQLDELVINWDLVRSKYSFSSLPREDQEAILKSLDRSDRETIAQQATRRGFELNLDKSKKQKLDPTNTEENIKDVIRGYTNGFTGKIIRQDGKPKGVMIQWKKKF